MKKCSALHVARIDQRPGRGLTHAPATHRVRLKHAPGGDDVRSGGLARQTRRPPFRDIPDAMDVTHVRSRQRALQWPSHASAEETAGKRAARVVHRHAIVLLTIRRRWRKARAPVGCRGHNFDLDARALQSLAETQHRPRRPTVRQRRRKIRSDVEDSRAQNLTLSDCWKSKP